MAEGPHLDPILVPPLNGGIKICVQGGRQSERPADRDQMDAPNTRQSSWSVRATDRVDACAQEDDPTTNLSRACYRCQRVSTAGSLRSQLITRRLSRYQRCSAHGADGQRVS